MVGTVGAVSSMQAATKIGDAPDAWGRLGGCLAFRGGPAGL